MAVQNPRSRPNSTIRSFYEEAIPRTGLRIFSTSEASGGISWAMAIDESGNFGDAVSIFPSGNGSSTAVQVTVGTSN